MDQSTLASAGSLRLWKVLASFSSVFLFYHPQAYNFQAVFLRKTLLKHPTVHDMTSIKWQKELLSNKLVNIIEHFAARERFVSLQGW